MFNITIDGNLFKGNVEEQWKDIEGFPDYQISDLGRVKSFKSGRAKILKPYPIKDGYLIIGLWKEGVRYQKLVHRLVLEAFVGQPADKTECNHKNGIKTDNRLENLEWVTPSENVKHAFRTGLNPNIGEGHYRAKLTNEEVLRIFEMANAGVPQKEIAEIFNVAPCTISNIKAGRKWSHLSGRSPEKPDSKNPAISQPISVKMTIQFDLGAF